MRIAIFLALLTLAAFCAPVCAQTPPVPTEIQEALKGLKDPDLKVRAKAAWVLGDQGKHAVPVLDELIAAFADPKLGIRASLADAFGQMGPLAKKAVPALLTGLKDEDPHVRRRVICALGLIKSEPQIVVPALIDVLKDPDNGKDLGIVYVPQAAVIALGNFGAEAKPAVPHLLKILHNEEIEWRFLVVSSLGRIGDPEAIPHLLRYLDEKSDLFLRDRIARSLASFGPKAKDAIPVLITMVKMKGDDPRTLSARNGALGALGKMGAEATAESIALLMEIARDKKAPSDLRQTAARGLGQLGPKVAKQAIPALIEAMDRGPTNEAMISLVAMGKEAVPHLIPLVKREIGGQLNDSRKRHAALQVLEWMGPEARDAIEVVNEAVLEKDALTAPRAQRTLDSILGFTDPEKK